MGYTKASFECDICGTLKKETNHWFLGRIVNNLDGTSESHLKLGHFKESDAKLSGRIILCGESCVHKFVSQNILTINPRKTEES